MFRNLYFVKVELKRDGQTVTRRFTLNTPEDVIELRHYVESHGGKLEYFGVGASASWTDAVDELQTEMEIQ